MRWARRRAGSGDLPPLVLRLGVLLSTRMHGIVSLELPGAFDDMGLDTEPLLEDEVRRIVRSTKGSDL